MSLCKSLYSLYQIETSDFFSLPGFDERYQGKLEGILGSVAQSYANQHLYPTLESAAAAYFVKICTQHPFIDGNKRMAVFFTDVYLSSNGVNLSIGWIEMYELAKYVVEQKENGTSPMRLQTLVQSVIENSEKQKEGVTS